MNSPAGEEPSVNEDRPLEPPSDVQPEAEAAPDVEPYEAPKAALARAQRLAAEQGLRPGSKPMRRPVRATGPTTRTRTVRTRDPELLGSNVRHLLEHRGWSLDVSAGAVMGRWDELVGPTVSEHAQPVTFTEGVLTVRATSTAWATQLTLMASSVIASIEAGVGPGVVNELNVVGPAAPSWVKGPRRVRGRGPRDTYG